MARPLGRGGVGDFGGCVAKKKSFTSAIPLRPRCINFNSSGAGQKYFSSYQLCWEDNYLSAVDWERCTLPSINIIISKIINITVIIIISIFNSTKTKSPYSKLHLMNVAPHSFCDSLEEKMNTINVYCLQQVLENGGCVLAEAEERPMKVLYHNICRNNF